MKRNLLWSLLAVSFVLTSSIFAQPELDTTYNSSGKVDLQLGIGGASDLAVQPDNKIVLAGECINAATLTYFPFCLARTHENGSRDLTFGNGPGAGFGGGVVAVLVPGSASGGGSGFGGVEIQPDGKLVMAGYSQLIGGNDTRVSLVRLNPDGSLDPTFGSGGTVTTDIMPNWKDIATQMAIQPDGKIVVVGYLLSLPTFNNHQQFVARYLSNGTLDDSFGKGGVVVTVIPENYTASSTITVQPDGKILVGSLMATLSGSPSPSMSSLLTRLNPDGSLDNTWDGDGLKTIFFGNFSGPFGHPFYGIFKSVAVQLDGRVVALIYGSIYRFNPDGSPDTSFDGDGIRPTTGTGGYDLIVLGSGKILITGSGVGGSTSVAKFNSDGSPDTSFSGDGLFNTGGNESGRAITMDDQGRIVAAGFLSNMVMPLEQPHFLGLRLSAPPVRNVAVSGQATLSNGTPLSNITIALQQNGTTIATARTNPFGYFSFPTVLTGRYYSVSIKSRALKFPAYRFFLDDEITNFNLVGESLGALSGRAEK
jgi:uncharacterized delta-60 repeat protein